MGFMYWSENLNLLKSHSMGQTGQTRYTGRCSASDVNWFSLLRVCANEMFSLMVFSWPGLG